MPAGCVDRRCGKRTGQASAAARGRPGREAEGSSSGPSLSPHLPHGIHALQHRLLGRLHRAVLALTQTRAVADRLST